MPYLQLRITEDTAALSHDATLQLLNRFVKKWIPTDGSSAYTCGVEEYNKYGEWCQRHVHLNVYFDPPDIKDPLRSAKEFLKKNAIDIGFRLKGNKVWSCTLVEEPKDYDRWIRYTLKEKPVWAFCHGVPDLEQLATDARHERKTAVEINILKREKAIDKQSFRDKLFKWLDDGEAHHTMPPSCRGPDAPDHPDHDEIWKSILDYYCKQGKAVCFKTISGYTILYQLHIGTIGYTECYKMRNKQQ